MKVLLISHMPPPTTGIGSWTRRVLEGKIPGWEIGFVNSNMIGGRDPFQNTKVNLRDEMTRSFHIWQQEATELKKDASYRIVHTNIPCTFHGMVRETITGIIAKVHGKMFVVHCHCTVPNVVNSRLKLLAFKLLSRFTDGYIVLNSQSREFVKKHFHGAVQIIPNFVNDCETSAEENPITREKIKNLLFVGGISPEKGCDTIIACAREMPEMTFHLVGIVSPAIRALTISQNVILYGNQSKEFVHDIMKKSDAFLFLSRYFGEGFSVALVEAMAAGLPCIVTDWAANADMVGNDGGRVVPQQDVPSLIKALNAISADPALRHSMSVNNISKVHRAYTASVVLPQLALFYDLLCNKRRIQK